MIEFFETRNIFRTCLFDHWLYHLWIFEDMLTITGSVEYETLSGTWCYFLRSRWFRMFCFFYFFSYFTHFIKIWIFMIIHDDMFGMYFDMGFYGFSFSYRIVIIWILKVISKLFLLTWIDRPVRCPTELRLGWIWTRRLFSIRSIQARWLVTVRPPVIAQRGMNNKTRTRVLCEFCVPSRPLAKRRWRHRHWLTPTIQSRFLSNVSGSYSWINN